MNRKELLQNLKCEDPDVVVDLLDISTDELIAKFPTKVLRYLEQETNAESDDGDEE